MTIQGAAPRAIRSFQRATCASQTHWAGILALLLAATACATSSAPSPNRAPQESMGCPHGQGPGCGPAASPGGPGAMHHGGMAMEDGCPLEVAGTAVRATDVDGGAALDFTTTGDVAEVRKRVAHMAQMHANMAGGGMMGSGGAMQGHGMMGGGMMGSGGAMQGHGMMGGGMMGMPPADVRVEDLPQGARLTFTPQEPKDLEALRRHLSEHASHAHPGSCPMMSMHGGAHAEAAPGTTR
jgi:hypothetical protein